MKEMEAMPFPYGIIAFAVFIVILILLLVIPVKEMPDDYREKTAKFGEIIKVRVIRKNVKKAVDEKMRLKRPYDRDSYEKVKYLAVFQATEIYNGDYMKFEVPEEVYYALKIGESGILTHNANVFGEFRKGNKV
ncbi:MAG: DUF2500 family protein [Oscillospiraceae bacterium]|jgi:hypothetical protein|nr:DUF2500 family protein [Oscillospiraceae bacterium]